MSHAAASLALLLVLPALGGCPSAWSPRAASPSYPPHAGPIPVHGDRLSAALHPEAYAIGSATLSGADLDEVSEALARLAARAGAQLVLLERQEAVVSSWTAVREAETHEQNETARQETVSVDSARITATGTGYRVPSLCLGARLVCEPVEAPLRDEATCELRVRGLVPAGPAARAGLAEGEIVIGVGSEEARSPSDIYRQSDQGPVELSVRGEQGRRALRVEPAACASVYAHAR